MSVFRKIAKERQLIIAYLSEQSHPAKILACSDPVFLHMKQNDLPHGLVNKKEIDPV